MNIRRDGINLHYERIGTGRPLVLVHGNGEDHTIFLEAAERLKNRFTCYLPDSRGHGKSSPAEELHYMDMADDVCFLIEKLGLDDAAFFGHSDGGIIGLLAAMKCPKIKTLIISGTNLTPDGLQEDWLSTFREMYAESKSPLLKLMLTEPDISVLDLAKIAARTLVLAGEDDMIRDSETRRIAGAIPDAKLRILKGEDHGSYVCHSEKIARIIEDFLAEDNGFPGKERKCRIRSYATIS